jgi:hypothetical protein
MHGQQNIIAGYLEFHFRCRFLMSDVRRHSQLLMLHIVGNRPMSVWGSLSLFFIFSFKNFLFDFRILFFALHIQSKVTTSINACFLLIQFPLSMWFQLFCKLKSEWLCRDLFKAALATSGLNKKKLKFAKNKGTGIDTLVSWLYRVRINYTRE